MGQYPWTEFLLFLVLRVIVFYPTRHRLYRVVVLAATFYVVAQIFQTTEVTDPISRTYLVGLWIGYHFVFTTYLLCAEGTFPDHWRRVRDEVSAGADPGDSDNLPSNFPLTKKLWWMIDITYSFRMVGWIQEPRDHLPPHPPPSRPMFLWKTFIRVVVGTFLVPDLITLVTGQSPAFDSRLHDPTDGPETYLAAIPFLRRVPYILAFGFSTANALSTSYRIVALASVGLGFSSPALWPDMWGRWGEAYTVRKLWGYVI
jgi:hypothetical protein